MKHHPGRYARLLLAFTRLGLTRELSFRANFLVKLTVELLWLGILLIFYDLVFQQTSLVRGWDRNRFLFFVGCYYTLGGMVETFFLENCTGFTDLVRSGDLDLYLLQPIDEQFVLSLQRVDWSTLPNIFQGIGVMVYALTAMHLDPHPDRHWEFDPLRLAAFLVLFLCGVALAYSFLLMLSCTAVWLVRNQSLLEMWWLFTTLMRYPRELFSMGPAWAQPIGLVFTWVIPVLVVVSVPADTMVRSFEPAFIALSGVASVALLVLSRLVFRRALRSYRSASS
jgi:ABC-2 type transport system permease protein